MTAQPFQGGYFLSCLRGSEPRVARVAVVAAFLSCLRGSERLIQSHRAPQ